MIVGVDVSSRRIDLAWLENGKPQRWHQELGGPKTHLIDRLRSIHIQWPTTQPYSIHISGGAAWTSPAWAPGHGITDVAIEMPFGQSRKSVGALMSVVGIVTRQAPSWARVAWPSSGELRAAIGARNAKDSAHAKLYHLGWPHGTTSRLQEDWDEHELDALVACIGWTRILAAQEDAA